MAKIYDGPLHVAGLKLNPLARKGMTAINHQRARCGNKNHAYYKYYGARGIRVEYDTREFIGWYIDNYPKFKGSHPTVGRIDHDKNYSLDNIRFESREDNSSESVTRNGKWEHIWEKTKKPVFIIERSTGKCIAKVDSLKEAARLTGAGITNVSQQVSGKIKRPWGDFIFTSSTRKKITPKEIVRANNRKRVTVFDVNMKPIKTFESAKDAARFAKTAHTHIRKFCLGQLKWTNRGYTFRYAD